MQARIFPRLPQNLLYKIKISDIIDARKKQASKAPAFPEGFR
jgi:hypothetical protein